MGMTLIVRDEHGEEKLRVDDVDQYMLIFEAAKRMDVKASCIMQWGAYAIKIAEENLTASMRRAEMEQELAKKGRIQTAQAMPGIAPGGKRQL